MLTGWRQRLGRIAALFGVLGLLLSALVTSYQGLDCGDGQPLQRLCLGGISRLLACYTSAAAIPEDVRGLLLQPAFLRSFCRAIALHHRREATEGGQSHGEQWSLGQSLASFMVFACA